MEAPIAIAKRVTANCRKGMPATQSRRSRFDRLVAHYYPAVYRFASRVAGNHREAVVLTRDAFNSVRKPIRNNRDEFALVAGLMRIVIQASKQ
jgi:DNA-directed RNA polymerase specialized sigma24 family protein